MARGEPRVLTADVRQIIRRTVHPDDPDFGDSVERLAEDSGTSTRTIYRILGNESDSLQLDLADRIVIAAHGHLSECRLVTVTGAVVEYDYEC